MSSTAALADFAVGTRLERDTPAFHAARRTLLNAVGVGVGGCTSAATESVRHVASAGTSPARASVIGFRERADPLTAALVNGVSMHVEDFDDTHMATIVHPGASVVPAALAAAELMSANGEDTVAAIGIG